MLKVQSSPSQESDGSNELEILRSHFSRSSIDATLTFQWKPLNTACREILNSDAALQSALHEMEI